jgi:hypothetical protein
MDYDISARITTYLQHRRNDPAVEWPYHPRGTDFRDAVRRMVAADLLQICTIFKDDARAGRIACDVEASLSANDLHKEIDFVVGPPISPFDGGVATPGLRQAPLGLPMLTLETKACMTSHSQASSRLLAELSQSLRVVREVNNNAVVSAIVVVNVSDRFTSPLNLPGPNKHNQPGVTRRLVAKLMERIAQRPRSIHGYDALGFVILDFDNEKHFGKPAQDAFVPPTWRYEPFLINLCNAYTKVRNLNGLGPL